MKRPSTRKGRIYATLAALAATITVAVPLALTVPGCGLQSEGQRCSKETTATHDGSEDCAEGLVCTSVVGSNTDVCCPESGTITNANCQAQIDGTSTSTSSGATSTGAGGAGGGTSTGTSTSTSTGAGGADGGI